MAHYIPKIEYGDPATEIVFDYPPKRDDGEQMVAKNQISESLSGVVQISNNHIEVQRKLGFSFLTEAIKAQLDTFFSTHAGLGKSFKFFEDQDGSDFVYYELDNFNYRPRRQLAKTANTYLYELDFSFRRVLGFVEGEDAVYTIANNQSSAANISGLLFDKDEYTSVILTCELHRETATTDKIANLVITLFYRQDTNLWEINTSVVGDDCGVIFSVTTSGQVQYTSDNMSGGSYVGTLKVKESRFVA